MLAIGLDGGAVRRVNAIHLQPLASLAGGGKATIAVGQQQGWKLVERTAILQGVAERNHDAFALAHADGVDVARRPAPGSRGYAATEWPPTATKMDASARLISPA